MMSVRPVEGGDDEDAHLCCRLHPQGSGRNHSLGARVKMPSSIARRSKARGPQRSCSLSPVLQRLLRRKRTISAASGRATRAAAAGSSHAGSLPPSIVVSPSSVSSAASLAPLSASSLFSTVLSSERDMLTCGSCAQFAPPPPPVPHVRSFDPKHSSLEFLFVSCNHKLITAISVTMSDCGETGEGAGRGRAEASGCHGLRESPETSRPPRSRPLPKRDRARPLWSRLAARVGIPA